MSQYILNPESGRPLKLYGQKYNLLLKKNILKDKMITADVITFNINENKELIEKVKNALPKKTGRFIANYKYKLISKNNKLTTEQLLTYICENYPNILEKILDVINEDDDDDAIKKKFSEILHNKLISGA